MLKNASFSLALQPKTTHLDSDVLTLFLNATLAGEQCLYIRHLIMREIYRCRKSSVIGFEHANQSAAEVK